MAQEISLSQAEKELAEAEARLEVEESQETRQRFSRASAQVKAVQKAR
jgi:hypothetical protein